MTTFLRAYVMEEGGGVMRLAGMYVLEGACKHLKQWMGQYLARSRREAFE